MITNIVVPMPMPMPIHGGSNGDPKIIIAFAIVVAIVSVLLIVGGIVYDGIKHNKWTLCPTPYVPDELGYMNYAKMAGYITLFGEIITIVLCWLTISVLELL